MTTALMTTGLTLADLTRQTGFDVLGHLERELTIPVTDGLQAQGDLIVVPLAEFGGVFTGPDGYWREVPPAGLEVLRSAAGGNPHTLVADPGTARWTISIADRSGLALGVLAAAGVAYLIHPEHGASGIAPGQYVIGRQRERGDRTATRLVAD